jgi:hypothetical protein
VEEVIEAEEEALIDPEEGEALIDPEEGEALIEEEEVTEEEEVVEGVKKENESIKGFHMHDAPSSQLFS